MLRWPRQTVCTRRMLDSGKGPAYADAMEVHFSPEQEAQLAALAAHSGIDSMTLVRDAALELVDETARFRAAVRVGLAQVEAGQTVDDDVVREWLEQQERR